MTSGSTRAAPEQGSWNVPGGNPAYAPPPEARGAQRGRGRPGVVALVVALVEIVVIAAGCNQSVSKHASRYLLEHQDTFLGRAIGSSLQFAWRVSPVADDNRNGFHLLYSQLVVIAVFVVLSALLAVVVVRGPVSFWRAFFGIWTAVIAAACVARVAGSFVTRPLDSRLDRATSSVFLSVNGLTFFAGAVLGLLTALIAALFAVSTRRSVEAPVLAAPPAEPAPVPETPPPFYGRDARPVDPRAESDTAALPSMSKQPGGEHPTQQLPEEPDDGHGRTTQIPRFDPRGGQNWTPPREDGGPTQALPNAPDDRPR